jgi:hypothetical protein
MKTICRVALAGIVAIPLLLTAPSKAANVTLDGTGYYNLSNSIRYYGVGAKQYGRYANLGSDYYHEANYSMEWITNRSQGNSGPLSVEFWGMPYYGATDGIVLMTRSANPLRGGGYYNRKAWTGWKVFLDQRRFPEINLWESTRSGWRFRDALSFRRSNIL